MKKLFALLLALVMVLPLVGCFESDLEKAQRELKQAQREYENARRATEDTYQGILDLQNDWSAYERARDALGD